MPPTLADWAFVAAAVTLVFIAGALWLWWETRRVTLDPNECALCGADLLPEQVRGEQWFARETDEQAHERQVPCCWSCYLDRWGLGSGDVTHDESTEEEALGQNRRAVMYQRWGDLAGRMHCFPGPDVLDERRRSL